MPSPFPGMNPYLEQEVVWHDFHERFLPAAATYLVPQIRPRYIVLIDENIYLHDIPPGTPTAGTTGSLVASEGQDPTETPWASWRHLPMPEEDVESLVPENPGPCEPRARHGRRVAQPDKQAPRRPPGAST